ncbi:30S ribosomal protein S21, chloroplastic [Benincasa hispida]|uniref:30S ribosomal protein S21, chloroplastic n=1 Tax=Benincasa hispida TaxID=102211 RepID=UPI0019024B65|nr:30S ribosomal protein S21, chloroplastic [Benincasa hispida]
MASLSSFFSFLLPSKPPPPKPHQPLIVSSPSPANHAAAAAQCQTLKSKDGSVSLKPQQGPNHSEPLSAELASVICPSLAFANTMFFRSAYNVQVLVDDNEPEERLLNRFRREVMRAGVIQECKRRRFFENTQDVRKRKTREAAKRNRRRRPQARFTPQNKQDVPATKQEADDDNWDLPEEENIPY